MKRLLVAFTLLACTALLGAQQKAPLSPPAKTTATVQGKTIIISYSSPRVRGREGKIFGEGGLISHDPQYPIWRAGANNATALHTDADLVIGGLTVPKGDYSLFIDLSNNAAWVLIISKQTGQWGLSYDKSQDLGRVKLTLSKPATTREELLYLLPGLSEGLTKGKLALTWENVAASVPVEVK